MPLEQPLSFDEALRASGVDSTLLIIDGVGHGFPRFELQAVKPLFDRFLLSSLDSA